MFARIEFRITVVAFEDNKKSVPCEHTFHRESDVLIFSFFCATLEDQCVHFRLLRNLQVIHQVSF